MKLIFFIIVLTCSLALAEENLNSNFKCYKQLKKELKRHKSKNSFLKVFHHSKKVIRTPTKKFGKWVQFSSFNNKFDDFWIFEGESRKKRKFSDSCELKNVSSKTLKPKEYVLKTFDDENLREMIKKGKGVIYIVNPSFRYSIKYMPELIKFAKKKNLELTVLFSSRSKLQKSFARSLASAQMTDSSLRINRSLELKMRQLELHSPSYIFYKKGKLVEDKLVGVHSLSSLDKFYKRKVR